MVHKIIGKKTKYTVIVDDDDAWVFQDYVIIPHKNGKSSVRARCWKKGTHSKNGWKRKDLSNVIKKPKPGFIVDHINGNPMDNRKVNLRYADDGQNARNRRRNKTYKGKKPSSRFKGVYWNKERKNWRACVRFEGKLYNVGSHDCEVSAAKSYDKKAIELHGSFAKLNFRKKELLKRY